MCDRPAAFPASRPTTVDDKILSSTLWDPKLWESWYIPCCGQCRIYFSSRTIELYAQLLEVEPVRPSRAQYVVVPRFPRSQRDQQAVPHGHLHHGPSYAWLCICRLAPGSEQRPRSVLPIVAILSHSLPEAPTAHCGQQSTPLPKMSSVWRFSRRFHHAD